MAQFENPSDIFARAYASSVAAGEAFNDAQRKNAAFNALNKIYGPIAGDPERAAAMQTYGQNEAMNPLRLEQQRLVNAGLAQGNAASDVAAQQAAEDRVRAARLQQAQALHSTLSSTIKAMAPVLQMAQTPEQRGQAFDAGVQRLSALIGTNPAEIAKDLAPYREQVVQNGAAALPLIQQELDAALAGGGTAAPSALDQAKLEQEQARTELVRAQTENARATAERGGLTPAQYAKAQLDHKAAISAVQSLETDTKFVTDAIDRALQQSEDPFATGAAATEVFGIGQKTFGNTPAGKLAATLETITSNVAFGSLRALKEAGGTLGQVSNIEEEMLKSSKGSLVQSQDKETLQTNLRKLKAFFEGQLARAKEAIAAGEYSPDGQSAAPAVIDPAASPSPTPGGPGNVDDILSKYGL